MKTAKKTAQKAFLIALFGAAIFLIFAGPDDRDPRWAEIFLSSKAYGALLITGCIKLSKAWKLPPWYPGFRRSEP